MALDLKNMAIRCTSGVIYIGLIIGAILIGSTGLAFLTSLFALGASYELEKQTLSKISTWQVTWSVDAMMLLCLTWFFSFVFMGLPVILLVFWCLFLAFRFIIQIFYSQPQPLKSISISLFSQFYIGLPLMGFCFLGVIIPNPWMLVCIIAMIWINDTGAYLVGCSVGRHKLIPRLSPNKSWEGFLGGLLFNIGAAFIFFYCFNLRDSFPISGVGHWIAIGIIVSLAATLGDLFESMIKRSLGIKDFGQIMPGHGGILDRIDSLLFVIPAVLILIGLISLTSYI